MELGLIDAIVNGGPVVILAFIIFWMYRRDRKSSEKEMRNDRIFMEDRMTKILEQDQRTRDDNTKALTELIVLLKAMNGRGN